MAELDLKLPNLRQGATADESIAEIYNYLKKQNEKLKYILNNLDVDSFNDDVKMQLATAVKIAETNNEVISSTQQLEQLIQQTASSITEELETTTRELDGKITVVSDAFGKIDKELKGEFVESPYGIALKNDVQAFVNSAFGGDTESGYTYTGKITAGFDPVSEEQQVTIEGARDGAIPFAVVVTPSGIFFKTGVGTASEATLAYFTKDDMFIKTVRTRALRFGGRDTPRSFYFDCDTDGQGVSTLRLRYDAQFDDRYYNGE